MKSTTNYHTLATTRPSLKIITGHAFERPRGTDSRQGRRPEACGAREGLEMADGRRLILGSVAGRRPR
jgi:hypothetical protein